jgi:hypothetical protein
MNKNNSYDLFDYQLKGRRVRLIHTDDPWTKLEEGDLGTVEYVFINLGEMVMSVKWDSGSNLSIILGRDSYELLPES